MSWDEAKWIVNEIEKNMFTAKIHVTYPAGATLTCSRYDDNYAAPNTSGEHTFVVRKAGTWKITISNNGDTAEKLVEVTEDGSTVDVDVEFGKIFGIRKNYTASGVTWERTDDAVGKNATASVGTVAGSSDFDNEYPYKGIQRMTWPTNDVVVKIPKFWYKRYREGNYEYIKVSNAPKAGFDVHKAFLADGKEVDAIYVGAYKTSSNNKSVSGAAPTVSQTRATMRANARAKGTGWSLIDISAMSAITSLILVEFATNDVQGTIGQGYSNSNNTGAINTGTTNGVANLTGRPSGTADKVDVVWRGIEGLWGNIWEWVDGVNWNNGTYYVCTDPSKYADDTTSGYQQLTFTGSTSWSASYITRNGVDTNGNSGMFLPEQAGSGSASTYCCDAAWSSTGWRVFIRGGWWHGGSYCGLFTADLSYASSGASTYVGSRLLYRPL